MTMVDLGGNVRVPLELLERVEARFSSDGAKREPELVCTACREVLCDVEHGDTLQVLVEVARVHEAQCPGVPPRFYECGICSSYHSATWDGDCREDDACFTADDLDEKYGTGGWEEVEQP